MGYRLPALAVGVVARSVPLDTAPLLGAGCGGGLKGDTVFDPSAWE